MPAVGNIVIADGQTTPVNHTFTPSTQVATKTAVDQLWENRSANGGIPLGFELLSLQFLKPNQDRENYKARLKLSLPTVETLAGAVTPSLAYAPFFDGSFVLPQRSTKQNRKDLRLLVINALANPQVVAAIDDLENTW